MLVKNINFKKRVVCLWRKKKLKSILTIKKENQKKKSNFIIKYPWLYLII